ncbi:DNA/RNA polymerases superfamily protein [Gossypium australe]|uniref:DNA/RNA polymerases superfamily protein n=1 Tax=Gossypium australe TaxID=47621 RepID=A0A5B6WR34_9ROSI|nr:DNA/RNA polymerases superfamily protein [Gossypium australe]
MKREILEFEAKCLVCQQVKAEHQVLSRLLQPIMIPEWKWERVTMDLVSGLHVTRRKKNSIWVFIEKLMKSAYFVSVRTNYSPEILLKLYVPEIVRLHGVLISIISNRDLRFTSRFWGKLQEAMGTKLNFSTTFHLQIDRQSERVIQILENMLQCCILEFEGSWKKYLPLAEFAYNNSYQTNIKMKPFTALYERKCTTPLYWSEFSESKLVGTDLICKTKDKVCIIRDCLKAALDFQKSYVDLKRKGIEFVIGDQVFLKDSPWKKVLALPPELEKIHNVFYVSLLRQYMSNPSHLPVRLNYNMIHCILKSQ